MRPLVAVVLFGTLAAFEVPALACCDDLLDAGAFARAPAPTPAPSSLQGQAAALGLHAVTTVYSGTSVLTRGDTTTYSALTQQRDAGTYARRVASAGTGETTPYDGVSANPRLSLSDGRRVAGDYYASFVVRGSDLVFDRFVFFADDSETLRRAAASPQALATPRPEPSPQPTGAPGASPSASAQPERGLPGPVATGPAPRPSSAPAPRAAPSPDPREPRDVRAGIALAPQADPLRRIEILRGRRAELWMRASVDGRPARVRAWRLMDGEITALGPVAGRGDEPLLGMWPQLPPPGSTFAVRVEVTVELPGGRTQRVTAAIDVAVRSPALIE